MRPPRKPVLESTIDDLLRNLGFEATAPRGRDRLDFREVHVGAARQALDAAFAAGRAGQLSGGMEATAPFWIVEDPGPDSTLPDICWKTSLAGLELQFRGGWVASRRPMIFRGRAEAEAEALRRLADRDAGRESKPNEG